ncbi:MAG: penicillin-binding protein 2 [Pseudomonadota bacterium]|nr:penicillin-binding protein 2 [Pseudomonadota bacterium]
MFKDNNVSFDNVSPNYKLFGTKRIKFKDKNDLIEIANNEKNVDFAKKSNFFFLLVTISFIFFIFFTLFRVSYHNNKNTFSNDKLVVQKRGKIIDRNGEIIATSIETKDLYIDTKKTLDDEELKIKLTKIFNKKDKKFFDKIFSKKQYSLIKTDLSPSDLNQLKKIGDPGIKLHNSKKRIYPQHHIFSHLTGFKTSNLKSKIEKNLDSHLANGENIQLTLDLRIQNIVREELLNSLKDFGAESALSIVMNVNSGEILSMVSLPDFNPNYPESILPLSENNLVTEARYEMGSTLKIFNAAVAFENESSVQNQEFDISDGYQITNEKKIKDAHIKLERISFDEVFTKSSNVGSVKILESVGLESQKEIFEKVGLTKNLEINGLNIVPNKLPRNWDSHSKFISYGYGISISPISMATAFSSLVNGGFKVQPKIYNQKEGIQKEKVLSSRTSKKINKLIQKIVHQGTGKKAFVEGISIGGKTGTSKKVEKGDYSNRKVITSFVGVFPAKKPEYLTFVLFDEPKQNVNKSEENTGGNTAAPTFSRIVKKIAPIINEGNYLRDL